MEKNAYWKEFMVKRLSRRSALKAGATVGAGLIVGTTLGCGGEQKEQAKAEVSGPKSGGTLNVSYPQDPPMLDPHITSSFATAGAISPIYNRLLKYKTGPDMDPHAFDLAPDLAEKWEIPDDVTYLFYLRKGVKFHNKRPVNGRELTAEDVKYSLERMRTDKSEYHARYMLEEVEKIETPDKYTVKVVMKQPYAPFINYMGAHYPWIVPKEVVDKEGDVKQTAIGTGPFMLEEYERNVKLVYKKNPDYFLKGQPYVDEMVYTIMPDATNRIAAFRTKQMDVDCHGIDYQQATEIQKSNPDAKVDEFLYRGITQIGVQSNKKPFNDVRVRQAMSLALDRKAFIDTLWFGKGKISGLLPPSQRGWALEGDDLGPYFKRDVPRAKRLLSEAGYPNGFKIELFLTNGYGPVIVNLGVMVKDQLKDVGIDAEIKQVEYAAFMKDYLAGTWKDVYVGYMTAFIEPDEFLYGVYHTKGSRNASKVSDEKLDAMLVKQRRLINVAERKNQIIEIQKYVNEQMYNIGLFIHTTFSVWQPYVKGYRPHSFHCYASHLYQDVWLEKSR